MRALSLLPLLVLGACAVKVDAGGGILDHRYGQYEVLGEARTGDVVRSSLLLHTVEQATQIDERIQLQPDVLDPVQIDPWILDDPFLLDRRLPPGLGAL